MAPIIGPMVFDFSSVDGRVWRVLEGPCGWDDEGITTELGLVDEVNDKVPFVGGSVSCGEVVVGDVGEEMDGGIEVGQIVSKRVVALVTNAYTGTAIGIVTTAVSPNHKNKVTGEEQSDDLTYQEW